jgi:predicted small secreted protein
MHINLKIIVLLILSFLIVQAVYSQDVIVKNNGERIEAKNVEVKGSHIKYKEWGHPEGPPKTLFHCDIFVIIYEDGKREVFPQPEEE